MFKRFVKEKEQIPKIAAAGIAKGYISMGYDAVAVSAMDLSAGRDFMDQTRSQGFPWISANVVNSDDQLAFQPYVIKQLGRLTMGIIGLTEESKLTAEYKYRNYKDTLVSQLPKLKEECDVIILLSNYSQKTNRDIANQFSEIDIIISSDGNAGKMTPTLFNNALTTQVSSRGKYLGKIDITWYGKGIWQNERNIPIRTLKNRRESIQKQIGVLVEDSKNTQHTRKIARLELQKKRLEKEISDRVAFEEKATGLIQNKHKVTFLPVTPSTSPKDIEEIVKNIKREIANYQHE